MATIVNKDGLLGIYCPAEIKEMAEFAALPNENPELFGDTVALKFETSRDARNTGNFILYRLTEKGLGITSIKELFTGVYQSHDAKVEELSSFWVFVTKEAFDKYIESILNELGIGTREECLH